MTQPAPQAELPVRFCPVCRVADDHPRHDIFGTDPNVAPHLDCCAAQGCPDGSCDINVWIATNDKDNGSGGVGKQPKGNALRAWLISARVRKVVDPLLDARDFDTRNFTFDQIPQKAHGSVTQEFVQLRAVGGNQ